MIPLREILMHHWIYKRLEARRKREKVLRKVLGLITIVVALTVGSLLAIFSSRFLPGLKLTAILN
jgi:hypothetical protein